MDMSRIVAGLWQFGLIFLMLAIASIFFYFEIRKLGFMGVMKNKFLVIILLMSSAGCLHLLFASMSTLCGAGLNSFPIAPQTRAEFSAYTLLSTVFIVVFFMLHYSLIYLRSNGTALSPRKMELPVKIFMTVLGISSIVV